MKANINPNLSKVHHLKVRNNDLQLGIRFRVCGGCWKRQWVQSGSARSIAFSHSYV